MENSFDGTKLPYELLPAKALHEVVQVLEFGKNKYGIDNWKKFYRKEDEHRFMGALLRHMFAYLRGEEFDNQTGITHLAHASCNLLFIQELKYIREGIENGRKEN